MKLLIASFVFLAISSSFSNAFATCLKADQSVKGIPNEVCIHSVRIFEVPTNLFEKRLPQAEIMYSFSGTELITKTSSLNLVKIADNLFQVSTSLLTKKEGGQTCNEEQIWNISLELSIDNNLQSLKPMKVYGEYNYNWDNCHGTWETTKVNFK